MMSMRETEAAMTNGCRSAVRTRGLRWAAAGILFLSGCGTGYFRHHADKGAYGIVQHYQQQTLGQTNAFSIDTDYSSRKPTEITPLELIEGRLRTNERVLTIEAAVDLAVKNSRDYQSQKETLYRTALTLSSTRYAVGRSVVPSSDATLTGSRSSANQRSASATVNNEAVASQLFRTGGRLTVDLLNSIMLYYSGRPELSFSTISGSLLQPLLRGFGRNNSDVETLTQADRNMVYAVRNFSYYQDQFALGVVSDYFRLLQQKDTIRNSYTNYLRRVESTRRLEARGVDRETRTSVDQARQAELTAKDTYVNAIASYRNSLDQFKITLGLPIGDKLWLDDAALDEVEATGLVPAPLDSDVAYHLAVQKQLQILNYIDQFEDSKRKARIAADQLKPRLDLTGSASLQSEGQTDYTRFNADQVSASAGLQLDLPLDRLPRGNAYRAALVTFESDLRTFTRRLDDLKSSIENGVRTLDQRRQNYLIQTNALMLANTRVESTMLNQRAGRAEVRDVNDALDSQVQAQNQVTAALVNYQQARLQLMLAIGALDTEKSKFWLKDHLSGFLPDHMPVVDHTGPQGQQVLSPDEYFLK